MIVNAAKTNCIIFGFEKAICQDLDLFFAGQRLTFVNEAKILGIWFDTRLNFSKHVMEIRKLLCYKIGIIRKAKSLLPYKIKLSLYYTHIHSILTYCNLV